MKRIIFFCLAALFGAPGLGLLFGDPSNIVGGVTMSAICAFFAYLAIKAGRDPKYLEAKAAKKEETAAEAAYQKERIAQLDRDGVAYCPKCYSTSLSANKKGFGIGKAITGAALTGSLGLMAGNIGAKKVRVTCLKCGYQFWAGKK